MKAKIINVDYCYDAASIGLRMIQFRSSKRPWQVNARGRTKQFHTHAKAVAWATRKVREGRK